MKFKKRNLILIVILFLIAAAVIFLAPIGTCQLGIGNPFNTSYQLAKDEPYTPGSISITTTKCSLFEQWTNTVIVVRM